MADVIQAIEDVKQYDSDVDEQLVTSIFRSLGPVVYNRDTRYVACSDPYELEMVREGFVKKQLGIQGTDIEISEAMQQICRIMSKSQFKLRVTFYYLLVKKYGKQNLF